MWISAAAVIITLLMIVEPVEKVEAGNSRLVIHTPQRIKTVHKYKTSEVYAKEFGHGEWYYRTKRPKNFRGGHPSHRSSSHRVSFRKGHHRKVGYGTPFLGGKTYGMSNYAKNYRNWSPSRRPIRRYRNSYVPPYNSQESQENNEDYSYQPDSHEQEHDHQQEEDYSSYDSKPYFETAVREIDHYAKRNRDFARGSIYDSVSKSDSRVAWNQGGKQDGYYQQDSHVGGTQPQVYSTLPDELINSPNSNPGKGFQRNTNNSNRGQYFRFKNQSRRQVPLTNNNNKNNFGNGHGSRINSHPGRREGNRFNNYNLDSGHESRFVGRNSSGRKGNRFKDQNIVRGHESQFNNYDSSFRKGGNYKEDQNFQRGRESQYNNYDSSLRQDDRNFERGRERQYNNYDSSFRQGGNYNLKGESGERYNDQYPSLGHDFGINEDHGTSYSSQSFGAGNDFGFSSHIVHSENNQNNNLRNVHDSQFSNSDHFNTQQRGTRNDFSFDKGTVVHDTEPPSHRDRNLRESEGGIEREISITSFRPQTEDAYLKAFGAFSFRKSSTTNSASGGQAQSASASVGRGPARIPSVTQNSYGEHNVRNNDQWSSHGGDNKNDHDIGFFEGLEDVNDGI